ERDVRDPIRRLARGPRHAPRRDGPALVAPLAVGTPGRVEGRSAVERARPTRLVVRGGRGAQLRALLGVRAVSHPAAVLPARLWPGGRPAGLAPRSESMASLGGGRPTRPSSPDSRDLARRLRRSRPSLGHLPTDPQRHSGPRARAAEAAGVAGAPARALAS